MNYQDNITKLKNLTVTEKDFSVIAKCFLDLTEQDIIYEQSKPLVKDQELYCQLVNMSIQQRYGNNVKVGSLPLQQIEDCHFIHGASSLSNGKMLAVYFFTDIYMGLAFTSSTGGETDFFRLSVFIDKDNVLSEKTIIPGHFSKARN